MKKQNSASRLDESLGMRRGAERDKKQSYKARRDESRGARMSGSGGSFNVPDNRQSGEVRSISTNAESYDMGRIRKYQAGSMGYPAEAWNYKY